MNDLNKNLINWLKDITEILERLDLPDEVKLTLFEVMEKMSLEQVEQLTASLYKKLIEQKVAEQILTDDKIYQEEKKGLDNETLNEINNVLNN